MGVKDYHKMLVTLLLTNAMASEALPLFFDQLVPSYIAVTLSVTFVLVFCEIIPSAVFTGPDKLTRTAALSPVIVCIQYALFCFIMPIKMVLDTTIGARKNRVIYSRAQLVALIRLHTAGFAESEAQSDAEDGAFTRERSYAPTSWEECSNVLQAGTSSEHLLSVEVGEPGPPVCIALEEEDDDGLSHMESELAQRSLSLSTVTIRHLLKSPSTLTLKPLPEQGGREYGEVRVDDSVSQAIMTMQEKAENEPFCVTGLEEEGTTTLEDVLWAALRPALVDEKR